MTKIAVTVEEAYNRMANAYDYNFKSFYSLAENKIVFTSLFYHFNHGSILDAGCGTGLLLENSLVSPYRYLGVDISEGMLEVAREKFPAYTFLKDDLLKFSSIRSSSIDNYISLFGSISYIEDVEGVINQMTRVLKPGGSFLWMLCGPPYKNRGSHITRVMGYDIPLHIHDFEYIRAYLKLKGYKVYITGLNSFGDFESKSLPEATNKLCEDFLFEGEGYSGKSLKDYYWINIAGRKL